MNPAEEVLANFRRRYLECKSYCDTGYLVVNGETEVDFKTHFVRPDKFRFDWRYYHLLFRRTPGPKQNMICADGQKVISRLDHKDHEEVQEENLRSAILSALSFSQGAAYVIYPLLYDKTPRLPVMDLKIVQESELMGDLCQCVSGLNKDGDEIDVWISKATGLLRKLRHTWIDAPERSRWFNAFVRVRYPEAVDELLGRFKKKSGTVKVVEFTYTSAQFDCPIDALAFSPNFDALAG